MGIRFRGMDHSAAREMRGFGAARLRQAVVNGQTQWWLDTEPAPNGLRDKTDIVFYTQGAQRPAAALHRVRQLPRSS